jgi:hypothetical protein
MPRTVWTRVVNEPSSSERGSASSSLIILSRAWDFSEPVDKLELGSTQAREGSSSARMGSLIILLTGHNRSTTTFSLAFHPHVFSPASHQGAECSAVVQCPAQAPMWPPCRRRANDLRLTCRHLFSCSHFGKRDTLIVTLRWVFKCYRAEPNSREEKMLRALASYSSSARWGSRAWDWARARVELLASRFQAIHDPQIFLTTLIWTTL